MSEIITAATLEPIGKDTEDLPSEHSTSFEAFEAAYFSNAVDKPISIIAKSLLPGNIYDIPNRDVVTLIAPGQTMYFNLYQALQGVRNPIRLGVQVGGIEMAQPGDGWTAKLYNIVVESVAPAYFNIIGDSSSPHIVQMTKSVQQ